MHPRNFGSEQIVPTYVHPFRQAGVKFCISSTRAFGGTSYSRTFWDKKQQQKKPILSFELILMSLLACITKKELEPEIKKQRRPISFEE